MPWHKGTIYLVTPGYYPFWLDLTRVIVINQSSLLPPDTLVMNSNAIEQNFDRIPGLTDYFIHMNDDYMMTSPVYPWDFFFPNGVPLHPLRVLALGGPNLKGGMGCRRRWWPGLAAARIFHLLCPALTLHEASFVQGSRPHVFVDPPVVGAVLEIECIPKIEISVSHCIPSFGCVYHVCIPTFKSVYHMCVLPFSHSAVRFLRFF